MSRPSRSGQPWTSDDNDQLRELLANGYDIKTIAKHLGRSTLAIEMQSSRLPKTDEPEPQHKEPESMKNTKVTVRTFVGNREASSMTNDELLACIEQEEAFIKRLSSLSSQTDKIKRLTANHKTNVKLLVELLRDE